MAQRFSRELDLKVRLGGVALLLLATMLLALFVVPDHRGADIAIGPGVGEFCVAFVAVCAASSGAAALFVGRALFAPVAQPPARRPGGEDAPRGVA
jgi:hypothetical protein